MASMSGPAAAASRRTPPTVVSSTGSEVSAGQYDVVTVVIAPPLDAPHPKPARPEPEPEPVPRRRTAGREPRHDHPASADATAMLREVRGTGDQAPLQVSCTISAGWTAPSPSSGASRPSS